ncbi:uncharacterized protein SPSK_06807 [Sporothrix schenckii 1099-18]|uniref:Uncharacterized protein n=1 Tax=Sporothrix schenckii 1099-18 TaxID=1397361 RepID=A0A0F2MP58_SPOSC|nr:uncharacterized protein SPSK_06807 [Sporothrix schenckii 1099-18]KJR89951.1 hypothetical protein SPSK_06807 [Sporothrix schenckii 1099-18]
MEGRRRRGKPRGPGAQLSTVEEEKLASSALFCTAIRCTGNTGGRQITVVYRRRFVPEENGAGGRRRKKNVREKVSTKRE